MFVFVYSPYQIKLLQNLQIVLDNQKNPYLNPVTPPKKEYVPSFPSQNSRKKKFQIPTANSTIPIAWNLGHLPGLQGFMK